MDDMAAIRVALLGMDTRQSGLLRVYIHMMSKRRCEVVDPAAAEVTIIDFDAPDAIAVFERVRDAHPDMPILGLSYGTAVPAGLPRLDKPIRGPELLAALYSLSVNTAPAPSAQVHPAHDAFATARRAAAAEVRSVATDRPEATAGTAQPSTPRPAALPSARQPLATASTSTLGHAAVTAPPVTNAARIIDTGDAQAAMAERYGDKFHIRGVLVSADASETFEVNSGPMKFVRKLLAQARRGGHSYEVTFSALPGASMRFHPLREGLVATSMPDGTLRSLSLSAHLMTPDAVAVSECAPYDPQHALARVISGKEFLWKLALWCGRGRRPDAISDSMPVTLKRWPNLTRVLPTDHATRICALLVAGPHSMADTARVLQIDIRFVHAICGAAHAIGLLRIHADAGPTATRTIHEPQPVATNPSGRTGLFGRIIQHIFR